MVLSTEGPKALKKANSPVVGTAAIIASISAARIHSMISVASVVAFPQPTVSVTVYQFAAMVSAGYGRPNAKTVPDCAIIPLIIGSEA